jgi:penicillin-binding protein 1A
LAAEGIVTRAEADEASARDLELAPLDPDFAGRRRRTHLTAAVMRELRVVAPDLAGQPGLRIHTTIDSRVQEEGRAALEAQLAAIESGRYGRLEVRDSLMTLEGAAVALEPRSGAVLAWIGGRDFARSEFDRVEQGKRQVGSLVKPFLVAAAIESGYGITDMVSADTVPIATDQGPWLPADHVQETELPLREALVRSSNRAAVHLGQSLGLERVARLAARGGLGDEIPLLPSSAIGAFDASLLDLATAYAPFGNGGLRVEPHLIRRIHGPDGSLLWERPGTGEPSRVFDERNAFVVLDALRAVVDRGTGNPIRASGYWGPAAGKTGTTNDGRDAWFVGLTPAMVAGVWIGYDQPRRIVPGRGGGDLAAPSWGAWMKALERTPRSVRAAWIPPSGVELVRYKEATGEVVDFSCDVQLGMGYHEAWVHAGRYRRAVCDAPGWLRRLWRGIVPFEPQPIAATREKPGRR